MYCNRERAAPGSLTEKQKIICMRVIALLAMCLPRSSYRARACTRGCAMEKKFTPLLLPVMWGQRKRQEKVPPEQSHNTWNVSKVSHGKERRAFLLGVHICIDSSFIVSSGSVGICLVRQWLYTPERELVLIYSSGSQWKTSLKRLQSSRTTTHAKTYLGAILWSPFFCVKLIALILLKTVWFTVVE